MAERLREDLWLFDLGLVPPFATNSYLLDDGAVTLVDPGLPWNRPSLRSELADAGYTIADIDRAFVTHVDLDHAGGLRHLVPEFDGPVYVGTDDLSLASGGRPPRRLHHKGIYHAVVRRVFPLPATLSYEPVDEGDSIDGFTVFHTPGHNPGHVVFVHDSGVAFLGDLVWESDGRLTPPFWGDSYSMDEVRESIRAFAERAPPFEVAAMAHGDPILEGGHRALVDCAARC